GAGNSVKTRRPSITVALAYTVSRSGETTRSSVPSDIEGSTARTWPMSRKWEKLIVTPFRSDVRTGTHEMRPGAVKLTFMPFCEGGQSSSCGAEGGRATDAALLRATRRAPGPGIGVPEELPAAKEVNDLTARAHR